MSLDPRLQILLKTVSTFLLIIDQKIDSPDEFITNAILNIQSVALNGPMDPDALDIWLDRLDQSINRADKADKYSTLKSEANALKGLDPITGSTFVGNPGEGNGKIQGGTSSVQGSPTPVIPPTTETAITPTTNLVTASQNVSKTASATSPTSAIVTGKPRGLPFQPQSAGSSTIFDFGLCSIMFILFF